MRGRDMLVIRWPVFYTLNTKRFTRRLSMSDDTPNTGGLSYEEKRKQVMTALRQVMDPEIGLSVVELGLIRDLEIEDDHVHVKMIMTTPFCPYAPHLLEMTRQKAQETLGVPTTIEIGMEMWDPSMAEDGILGQWGLF
jgi:metal-sulfur cluster biosynthetic enzyme